MSFFTADTPSSIPAPQSEKLISNSALGMLIFVICEVMLFAGMISAFMIVRTSALGAWPPPGQPRLPIESTLINTAALLLSGIMLFRARGAFKSGPTSAVRPYLIAVGLGAFFVLFQGYEWLGLIREGLTLTSSNHGSFFYLIVGTHALHALGGLIFLGLGYLALRASRLEDERFQAIQIFWYFVVLLWPILYVRVYL